MTDMNHLIKKPYGFIHNINGIYHKFNGLDWFYNADTYSEGFKKECGWRFDGQMFYRKKV